MAIIKEKTDMNNADEFIIENGVLFKYNGDGGDVIIPDGVICIGDLAFYRSKRLTSVVIPDGVELIGAFAFNGCSNLTGITFPKSVIYIGVDAFDECEGLKDEDGFIILGEILCRYCGKMMLSPSQKV